MLWQRTSFVLHVLLASADPTEPLCWRVEVDEPTPPHAIATGADADVDAACMALVAVDPLRLRIAAIINAHATGFGRLRGMHVALMHAFCPA